MSHFARYELLGRIGSGGTAIVYLARMSGSGGFSKTQALKVLFPHFADDPEFVTMFANEAKLVADLVHPHIAQVHDFGHEAGRYYIAMEYVAGCNAAALQEARGKQPLPTGAVAAILGEVLQALHYAHEKRGPDGASLGVVHRDISPHNVLVSREGVVKVTDFGTAKVLNSAKTRSGVLKGKFAYMSPEHALGRAVDRRSDIFSAALLAYELLTGQRAYAADSEMKVLAQAQAAKVSRIDNPLWAALERALMADPALRYPTAQEFAHALAAAAQQGGEPAWDEAALAELVCRCVPEPRFEAPAEDDFVLTESPPAAARRSVPLAVGLALAAMVMIGLLAWRATRAKGTSPPDSRAPLVAETPPPLSEPESVATDVATPSPRAAPPLEAFGFLTINSRPWSRVLLDGVVVAEETPLKQRRVRAGKHTVTLRDANGKEVTFAIEIASGSTTTRFFDWSKHP